jgi:hypothetical protein
VWYTLKDFHLTSIGQLNAFQNLLFVGVFKVARITYIYWPINCTEKISFMGVFEIARNTYIYWPIECTSKL